MALSFHESRTPQPGLTLLPQVNKGYETELICAALCTSTLRSEERTNGSSEHSVGMGLQLAVFGHKYICISSELSRLAQ